MERVRAAGRPHRFVQRVQRTVRQGLQPGYLSSQHRGVSLPVTPATGLADAPGFTERAAGAWGVCAVPPHATCEPQDGQLVEPIVPVSVSCQCLDFARLSSLGKAVPEQPGYVKLAFVDTDGTVTISKLHSGVHMPEEKLLASEEPD